MPTPPKPFKVLSSEKKSHRTKAELNQRKHAEAGLATGTALKERKEVKSNEVAHKEFLRINKLLKNIEKNDAIYEPVINRYCMIIAECKDLEERREEFYKLIQELKIELKELVKNMEAGQAALYKLEYSRELAKMMNSMLNCDKQIQTKRKMLLEIEKENIMTIASALRSIPKKVEKKTNALLEALGGD